VLRAISLLAGLLVVASPLSSQSPRERSTSPKQASVLRLESYTDGDGAITVFSGGSYVEPYFAMRALNTAADLGFDIDSLARRYVTWQLARLDGGTSFKRYCRGDDGLWSACGVADADDAALALWIELLYRTAGRRKMPASWRHSLDLSRRALASLWDAHVGVYVVSSTVKTGLFMDNIEVLSALETAARTRRAVADGDRPALLRGATRLRAAITRVFWNRRTATYRISTQPSEPNARFYPEVVGQVFPAAFAFGNPMHSSKALVAQWLRRHEQEWVAAADSGAAWGLVAAAAARTGHRAAVDCWLERTGRIRSTSRWNVVDEVIFVILSAAKDLGHCSPDRDPSLRQGRQRNR